MKITKTLAILCVLGAGLLAFTSCKDTSGDGKTSAADSAAGVAEKWALKMEVDATGDEIKVGGKAIIDSNEGTEDTIEEDTDAGKTTPTGHALQRQRCGKRSFKEITGGFNNTEGFRTNIVLKIKDGTKAVKWCNPEVKTASGKPRTAGAGMIFDFNQYEKVAGTKTYDFFFLSFKPTISGDAITGVTCFFERYSGVKKYKEGIYSSHAAASALGKNYIQTAVGTWDNTLYDVEADKTYSKDLTKGTDYYLDSEGSAVIGVDVKQIEKGEYTVRIGKISYKVKDVDTEFTASNFKQSWKTTFTAGTTMGKGGDKAGTSSIEGYTNWTHVKKDDTTSNLKGGVMVYGFAPYGTNPVAAYYTCNTKLASNTAETEGSGTDYVGDWNRAKDINDDGVVYEYVYY